MTAAGVMMSMATQTCAFASLSEIPSAPVNVTAFVISTSMATRMLQASAHSTGIVSSHLLISQRPGKPRLQKETSIAWRRQWVSRQLELTHVNRQRATGIRFNLMIECSGWRLAAVTPFGHVQSDVLDRAWGPDRQQ